MNRAPLIKEAFPAVSFGTSGVRALVSDLTTAAVSSYVHAFMQGVHQEHATKPGCTVAVGMDLRPSSPAIAAIVCEALQSLGYRPEFLGALPTPALALRCLTQGVPGVMVTGSHIPFDRNGIKFYSPAGEILKADEQAIMASPLPLGWLQGLSSGTALPQENPVARQAYATRYLDYFGTDCLTGLRVGVYEHSAVGRDLTRAVLQSLGASVIRLGRSDDFVPVDTEAVADADLTQAQAWCKAHQLDALVSTDGDGDRPLVFDETGAFVRGDLLGLLCASELGIRRLVVPVSCNTAIEQCGRFEQVLRTRIGSPFVIAGLNELSNLAAEPVAGFEANGGFLLGTATAGLSALPTRDALLPMLCLLARAVRDSCRVSDLLAALPSRHTFSDRIKDVPGHESRELLERLATNPEHQCRVAGKSVPPQVNTTDGVRLTFGDGDIVHLRASGNAPELRCYAEASSIDQARALCGNALSRIR